MKKGDFLWLGALLLWVLILVVPASRAVFENFTASYAYPASFIKFAILATMGELLALRLRNAVWTRPAGLILRVIVWGIIGIAVALVFTIYNGGAILAQQKGLLPGDGNTFLTAFLTSAIMNLTFGPMLFVNHKLSDTAIDIKFGKKENLTLSKVIAAVDWQTMVRVTWLRFGIFFWIPAHTIVFLLPPNYRIIASAFLSIAMGIIACITKPKLKNS